ncbi:MULTISPECIES: DUF4476 domain-containing protein [Bacteroides]|uniref:DUF4476 domain-containing protein n=1 Tax=Bacteroides TaxID=816 RepID=UPI0004B1C2E1|nr:DUF4476 domain-containing protein [Bacteroides neonati]
MKKIQITVLLLFVVLLSSCSTYNQSSRFKQIQKGMTQQEVIALCGEPVYKRFDEVGEEWEYRAFISYEHSVIIINFADGRVVALDMFKEPVQTIIAQPTQPVTPPIITVGPGPTTGHRPGQCLSPSRAMSDREFAAFLHSVKSGFSSDRLKKIKEVPLTSAQCKVLVDVFSFTNEKIEAMIEMYPQVVDKRNYYQVIDMLTFTSEKDQVRDAIKRYNR